MSQYNWPLARSANHSPYAFQRGYFSSEECRQIIKLGLTLAAQESYIGTDHSVDQSIRRNLVSFFSNQDAKSHWIFERCSRAVHDINQQFWQFDINEIETLQFTRYDRPGDFYTWHQDLNPGLNPMRKLGFSVQLSEANSYTGGDLVFHRCGEGSYDSVRDQGAIIVFPSYQLHQVTELESGTRYSLVGWALGRPFR